MSQFIPDKILEKWKNGSTACAANWLERMLELREILDEHREKGNRVLIQIYDEAAPSFGISAKALQNKMGILREYTDKNLTRWIVEYGLSIDAIKTVNRASDNGSLGKTTPEDYIEKVLLNGDGNGEVPTKEIVETLIAEATGKPKEYYFNVAAGKLAKKWNIADVEEFTRRLIKLAREMGAEL